MVLHWVNFFFFVNESKQILFWGFFKAFSWKPSHFFKIHSTMREITGWEVENSNQTTTVSLVFVAFFFAAEKKFLQNCLRQTITRFNFCSTNMLTLFLFLERKQILREERKTNLTFVLFAVRSNSVRFYFFVWDHGCYSLVRGIPITRRSWLALITYLLFVHCL